jgi:ABC-type taurine transport system ATPase subunit
MSAKKLDEMTSRYNEHKKEITGKVKGFLDGNERLMVLIGPPGCGKQAMTTAALDEMEVPYSILQQYPSVCERDTSVFHTFMDDVLMVQDIDIGRYDALDCLFDSLTKRHDKKVILLTHSDDVAVMIAQSATICQVPTFLMMM